MIKSMKNLTSAGIFAIAAASGIILAAPTASAQSSAAQTADPYLTIEQAGAFSKQIERTLAHKQARIALVFRSGRERAALPDGVEYTHGALWVYQPIKKADGSIMKGYAVHNLYHGDGETLPKTQSYLAQDFPFDFINGSKVDDVAVIIPTQEMQKRIIKTMASDDYTAMHVSDYSLIANPHDSKFQNCNEFLLDVISSAAWQTTDYKQIKANLREHFEPQQIEAGILKRMFAPLADSRLKMQDQSGGVQTVTYASIAEFMDKFDMSTEHFKIMREEQSLAES